MATLPRPIVIGGPVEDVRTSSVTGAARHRHLDGVRAIEEYRGSGS